MCKITFPEIIEQMVPVDKHGIVVSPLAQSVGEELRYGYAGSVAVTRTRSYATRSMLAKVLDCEVGSTIVLNRSGEEEEHSASEMLDWLIENTEALQVILAKIQELKPCLEAD